MYSAIRTFSITIKNILTDSRDSNIWMRFSKRKIELELELESKSITKFI